MPNAGPNPDHGYTTFDNMGWSLIMALQILTMDFWENIYNKVSISNKFFCGYKEETEGNMRHKPDFVRPTSGSKPWKRSEKHLSDYHDRNYKLTFMV